MMICGNKHTLGNTVTKALTEENMILTNDEITQIKESGRWLLELWDE
jgi:hypothetical protein